MILMTVVMSTSDETHYIPGNKVDEDLECENSLKGLKLDSNNQDKTTSQGDYGSTGMSPVIEKESSRTQPKLDQADEIQNMQVKNSSFQARKTSCSLLDEELSTKATPRQVFPYIYCLSPKDNLIFCFILSVWDNIVGPQTVYVWRQKTSKKLMLPCSKRQIVLDPTKTKVGDFYKRNYPAIEQRNLDTKIEENCEGAVGGNTDKLSDQAEKPEISLGCSQKESTNICTGLEASSKGKILYQGSKKGAIEKQLPRIQLRLCEVVKYVSDHSVGVGEITKPSDNKLVTLYLSVHHKRIVVFSVRFHLMDDEAAIPFCLSGIVHIEDEDKFLPYLDICSELLQRICIKIRLTIAKEGLEGGRQVTGDLIELSNTISALMKANISLYKVESLPDAPSDRHFAEQMLTSHLQTGGYSLIVANSPSVANKVVMWLSQFSLAEDSLVSRFAFSDKEWPYQAGPSIQAVIRDVNGGLDISSSKLLCCGRPLTLIDLSSGTVRQMAKCVTQQRNYLNAVRAELISIWHDLDHVGSTSQSLFETVKVTSPLVKRFLHDWGHLSSCELSVRKKYLEAFKRSLHHSSLAIVIWIRQEWCCAGRPKEKTSLRQELLSAFQLEESDLKILLAFGENFEPGLMAFVFK